MIFVGDTLKSKWNYNVLVCENEKGRFFGKLINSDKSTKNMEYSIAKGKGYTKIFC